MKKRERERGENDGVTYERKVGERGRKNWKSLISLIEQEQS